MDNFTFNLILVTLLIILQGILWAWVGLQARKIFPWWPFMREDNQENRFSRQSSSESASS